MVTPIFRVGILSDETLLMEGQKVQGKLDQAETEILVDYIQTWLEGPEDEDGDDYDDEEEDEDDL